MPKQRITADDVTRKLADVFNAKAAKEKRSISTATGSAGTQGNQSFTNPMVTEGDILIAGESGSLVRLPVGTAGQVLTVVDIGGGVLEPRWVTP